MELYVRFPYLKKGFHRLTLVPLLWFVYSVWLSESSESIRQLLYWVRLSSINLNLV